MTGEENAGSGVATFCAGSFWDLEAAFRHRPGVLATRVGYMGGTETDPAYEDVSSGKTGHSEVVMVAYNPEIIPYRALLAIFFENHDPCSPVQGDYVGPQYSPVIFYHSDEQKEIAGGYIRELISSGRCKAGVVTRLAPAETFYIAEDSHQQYYEKQANSYSVVQNQENDLDT